MSEQITTPSSEITGVDAPETKAPAPDNSPVAAEGSVATEAAPKDASMGDEHPVEATGQDPQPEAAPADNGDASTSTENTSPAPADGPNDEPEGPTYDLEAQAGNLIKDGDSAVLIGTDGKKLLIRVEAGKRRGTHYGEVKLDELIGKPWGHAIATMKGKFFYVLKPSLEDFIFGLKRATQIIYPKDIGPIMMKLGVFDGSTVIECGCGSGALTLCLAAAAAPTGRIYAYDKSETHQTRCKGNLKQFGLDDVVTFRNANVLEDGFEDEKVDAVFLDLKDADLAVPHAANALKPGGKVGVLVPTMNQVSDVIQQLKWGPFIDIEVLETFYRTYKVNPERMRPADRMIGHTGYLVFARRVMPLKNFEIGRKRDKRDKPKKGEGSNGNGR